MGCEMDKGTKSELKRRVREWYAGTRMQMMELELDSTIFAIDKALTEGDNIRINRWLKDYGLIDVPPNPKYKRTKHQQIDTIIVRKWGDEYEVVISRHVPIKRFASCHWEDDQKSSHVHRNVRKHWVDWVLRIAQFYINDTAFKDEGDGNYSIYIRRVYRNELLEWLKD